MKIAQKVTINYLRAKLNIIAMVSARQSAAMAFDIFCTPYRKPKRKRPAIFLTSERLSFELEGKQVHGYRWNHPRPQKVLILHGFESTCRNFDRYISQLIKRDVEVIAFDAPAHGKSGGKRIDLPLYVSTIRQIYHLFGPINGYIAHSFGGLALSSFIETIPHEKNDRLVLIAPATETTSSIDSFFTFLHLPASVRREFDKLILEKGGVPPSHYSIRRAMNQVQARVLWIHDEDDELTPVADALKVRDDDHPNIQFEITKGLGHRRIYRDNNVVNQVIDFIAPKPVNSEKDVSKKMKPSIG